MRSWHREHHLTHRIGWLRAAVLGANDGVISTASLIVGVAAAHGDHSAIITAGLAGLVGGAMSMAAGEYVSVSSQADMEQAQTEVERKELETDATGERKELANIYVKRGLSRELAAQVADALTAHDALGAHLRDELGITPEQRARPVQAAVASAASFASGAGLPLLVALFAPAAHLGPIVTACSLATLTGLGAVAARAGGAPVFSGAIRVLAWGVFAFAATAGVGALFGTAI
jgi:VIT1/CCC1 family predicted Fe2+/Mn2+ transporter